MGIGVDAEVASHLKRQRHEVTGRVAPLGPTVDLDRHPELSGGLEHQLGIELAGWAHSAPISTPGDHSTGAVAQDCHAWIRECRDHPRSHLGSRHPQLTVNGGYDDIEFGEQVLVLIQCSVVEDVHLDARQEPEVIPLGVEVGHHLQLPFESLPGQAVGNGESG